MRDYALKSLQQEGFDSIVAIPAPYVNTVHELLEFRRSHFELLDYDHISKLQRKLAPLGTALNPNCHELLRAFVEQESKTIQTVLIYYRKIIQFEKEINSDASDPISYEMKYDKATAEVNEIAGELGLKLP